LVYCVSVTTDNASVNDVLIATVSCILLAKYGIPQSPNLHIRCICHVVNLVVQATLAALGEVDDPDLIDYHSLHKEQPFHLDIDEDPAQAELDNEQFEDDAMARDEEDEENDNIIMEDEEREKAMNGPLSKVRFPPFNFTLQYIDLEARH
jgi:hypothetical protein